jgi:hypothetical protein
LLWVKKKIGISLLWKALGIQKVNVCRSITCIQKSAQTVLYSSINFHKVKLLVLAQVLEPAFSMITALHVNTTLTSKPQEVSACFWNLYKYSHRGGTVLLVYLC